MARVGPAKQVLNEQVATGQMLNLAMEQTGGCPNMAVQMIGIGEESGNIDAMSGKVADFFEDSNNMRWGNYREW